MNKNFIDKFPLENKYKYNIKKIKYDVDLDELYSSRYIGNNIKEDIKNNYNSYYCELIEDKRYNFIININRDKISEDLINWIFYIKKLFRYNKKIS